jgi:hypothetical protein
MTRDSRGMFGGNDSKNGMVNKPTITAKTSAEYNRKGKQLDGRLILSRESDTDKPLLRTAHGISSKVYLYLRQL